MKVMLIDVNFGYSSTGRLVEHLYLEAQSRGIETMVCFGRGATGSDPNVVRISSKLEFLFHVFMTRATGLTGVYSPLSTKVLLRHLEDFSPDVVHIHELHGYFVNIEPIVDFLKRKKIRTVWTFHCEFMYTGKCGHAHECEKWKSECGNCPQLTEYPKSIYFDFTRRLHKQKREMFRDFDNLAIVTPSNWLAERVKESFLGDKMISVVPNGINQSRAFQPRETAELRAKLGVGDRKVILSVGSGMFSEAKGGRFILDIARQLADESLIFFIVGTNNPEISVPPNVRVIAKITDPVELSNYYSLADLCLLTSKRETFSLVTAESLSCGTPVVGFDAGAPTEIALPPFGRFVPYGCVEELEKALVQSLYLKTPEFSRKCREYAELHFGIELMLERYFSLYGA